MTTAINKVNKVDFILFEAWLEQKELSNMDRFAILQQIAIRDQEIKELQVKVS